MSKKIQLELDRFPTALEKLVNQAFPGANCVCTLQFFEARGYATAYDASHPQAKEIEAYIRGFMAGNEDLRTRVYSVLP
jgi:hypothetical protein